MLKVKRVLEKFGLVPINIESADLNREINSPAIHRYGLEMAGYDEPSPKMKNVIGWGTKESKYLSKIKSDKRKDILRRLIGDNTPLIILSSGVTDVVADEILQICNEFNIPLVKSKIHLSNIIMTVGWYIVKHFADSVDIHGSLVIVNGIGTMIIGKSGIGKSEAVLELIQKGSSFISDDTVVIKKIGTEMIGGPAHLTKDFLEARGIGLIDIPKIYGLKSTKDSVKIDLVIELLPSSQFHNVDRLGNQNLKFEVLGGSIDKIQIPVENGRTLSALIEAAVNVYIAKVNGHNPLDIISERRE